MKCLRLLPLIAALWLTTPHGFCQVPCQIAFLKNVELQREELLLADVLDSGVCPWLLRAAGQVSLGKAPLEGSPRVLEGSELRALVERIARSEGIGTGIDTLECCQVPERIVVRRAGPHLSCSDIAAKADLIQGKIAAAGEINCGASGRIGKDVRLQPTRKIWNGALHSWEFTMRCTAPTDCVPFLIRVAGSNSAMPMVTGEVFGSGALRVNSAAELLLRAGQKTTLVWEQAGIRMVLAATCLDAGGAGDSVRARLESSGRIMRASVTAQGTLLIQR